MLKLILNRAKFCIENYLKSRALSFNTAPNNDPLFVNDKDERVPTSTIQRRIRNYIKLVAEGKLNLGANNKNLEIEQMKIKNFRNNIILSFFGIVIIFLIVF